MRRLSAELLKAALAMADARYVRDEAVNSLCLSNCFAEDHPRIEDPEDARLDRYYRTEWAPCEIKAAWKHLQTLFDADDHGGRDKLVVWRNVCVHGDPLEAMLEHLRTKGYVGLFWSHDRDTAHPHDSTPEQGKGLLMSAVIDRDDVDWVATLASYGHPDWTGENEVRLKPDALVPLASLELREGWLRRSGDGDGIPVELGEWEGRAFSAGTPRPDLVLDFEDAPTFGM